MKKDKLRYYIKFFIAGLFYVFIAMPLANNHFSDWGNTSLGFFLAMILIVIIEFTDKIMKWLKI